MMGVTIIRGALRLCEEEGVTLDELQEYLTARSKNSSYWLRIIRYKRTYGGFDWVVDERQGRIQIRITGTPPGEEL